MKTNRLFALGLMMALAGGACGDDSGGTKPVGDGGPVTGGDGGPALGGDAGPSTNPDGGPVVVQNPDGGPVVQNPDGGPVEANPDGGGVPGPNSKLITSAGGSVSSADGVVTVTFSRFALKRPTTVSITVVAQPPAGAQGAVYAISPATEALSTDNGATTKLTVKYTAADLGTNSPQDLKVGQYVLGRWVELNETGYNVVPTKANPTAMNITATLHALAPVALLGGVCIDCPEVACTPANCLIGTAMTPGKCVATGNGCSVCRPTCDADNDGTCTNSGDCNDNNPKINGGAVELCNGVDDDCDLHTDEGCKACKSDAECTNSFEACQNGVCDVCGSCDPTNCFVGPDTARIPGVCQPFGANGTCGRCVATCDKDGDGQCPMADPVHNIDGGDCNDNDASIKLGGVEICGNAIDDNCDKVVDENCNNCTKDADCPNDGLICIAGACVGCSTTACDPAACAVNGARNAAPGRCVAQGKGCFACVPTCDGDGDGYCPGGGGDCDDGDPKVHGDAAEVCGNAIDDNCNGHKDEGCTACAGSGDCKVGQEWCNEHGACDVCGTCDVGGCRFPMFQASNVPTVAGTCFPYGTGCAKCVQPGDLDGDGQVTDAAAAMALAATPSIVLVGGDCDDTDPATYKGAPELCGDMKDNNCNGKKDELCITCATSMMCGMPGECDNSR